MPLDFPIESATQDRRQLVLEVAADALRPYFAVYPASVGCVATPALGSRQSPTRPHPRGGLLSVVSACLASAARQFFSFFPVDVDSSVLSLG